MTDSISSKQLFLISNNSILQNELIKGKKRLGLIRKNKTSFEELRTKGFQTGKWNQKEHLEFLQACLKHGNNWTRV